MVCHLKTNQLAFGMKDGKSQIEEVVMVIHLLTNVYSAIIHFPPVLQ